MAKKLTDIGIRNLKPGAVRREIPDGGCAGLYLIQQPNGKRSWAVRYRYRGDTRKLTLGSLPAITLAEARKLTTEALHDVGRGIDPAAVKKSNKLATAQAALERAQDSIERLTELYLEQHAKRKTRKASWKQAESIFRREVLPRWRGRLVADITRKDVRELVRTIVATRPILANRCQAHLSRFFRWLVNEDYITGSPVIGIERPAKENVRDRALNDGEVRRFWAATDQLPVPFGAIYKLLLLSAARRQEIADLQWRELDLAQKVWTLPASRSKNRKPVMLPLGPMAWNIIEAQPRIAGSDFVFGWGRSGFGHMKRKLDAALQFDQPWVTHDLRRTARSLLARARVPDNIAELMLGHLLTGMARVYNVHGYLAEKREGFAKLEREIDHIINPPDAAVLPFRR